MAYENQFYPKPTTGNWTWPQRYNPYYPPPQTNVCPGCGRCNCCGRPTPQPVVYPTVTWSSSTSTQC